MSTNKIIAELDAEQMTREVPEFAPGDTVVIQVRVKEGNPGASTGLRRGLHWQAQSGPQFGFHSAQDFPRCWR
jgi:hypothetical protein